MPVKRSGSFGTYFFIGTIGMLIGSVIGKILVKSVFKPGIATDIINLYGYANYFIITAGERISFNLNLIAILGILLAIYIYRRI